MHGYKSRLLLLVVVGLFALSGASCPNMLRPQSPPLPRALPPSPTLDQLIQVVNGNNSRIQSFYTGHATLSGPGIPALSAKIAFGRPNFFRLYAASGLTGGEVDLGSNPEVFWYWVRRSQPPAIYYCRHDQFANSPARFSIPVQPDWLIEALGVSEIDPGLPHQGPFPLQGDRLRINTIRETPDGPVTKVSIFDGAQGWVLEQYIYNAQGILMTKAVASGHRRDPLSGLVMPGAVTVDCPSAQFSIRIDLGPVEINRLSGNAAELWTMPQIPGAAAVNLANPNVQPMTSQPPGVNPAGQRQF
ncbi:MAG: hypothetical protein ABSA16_16870 [Thermoguttaceae bacterium]|jgi:hypothetical protein